MHEGVGTKKNRKHRKKRKGAGKQNGKSRRKVAGQKIFAQQLVKN